jgi:hypothetical protein
MMSYSKNIVAGVAFAAVAAEGVKLVPSSVATASASAVSSARAPAVDKPMKEYSPALMGQFVFPEYEWTSSFQNFPAETNSDFKDRLEVAICFSGASSGDWDLKLCLPDGSEYTTMKNIAPNATHWYSIGGGDAKESMWFSDEILDNFDNNYLQQIKNAGYAGVFYDIEVIYSASAERFAQSFATAKNLGLTVNVSTSYTAMYDSSKNCEQNYCPDGSWNMAANKCDSGVPTICQSMLKFPDQTLPIWKSIVSNENVDVVLPQFYDNGTDAAVIPSNGANFSVKDLIDLTVANPNTVLMPLLKIQTLIAGTWEDNINKSVDTLMNACADHVTNGESAAAMCNSGFMVYTGA